MFPPLRAKEVPEGFPHFQMNVGETCHDSKTDQQQPLFLLREMERVMVWIFKYSGGNVYEGRETKEGSGPVYIKVSYAAKKA